MKNPCLAECTIIQEGELTYVGFKRSDGELFIIRSDNPDDLYQYIEQIIKTDSDRIAIETGIRLTKSLC